MDPTLSFLLLKMAVTAAIVVTASLIAERTGPLLAAMVATLPVSAGPVYVFLALDHDAAFIAEAALGSMGSNMATTAFSLAYVLAAQRLSTWLSLVLAFCAWGPVLLFFKAASLPIVVLFGLVACLFPLCHRVVKPYLAARPATAPRLAWYAIPLRAFFVAALVGTVTTLSLRIGPQWSGFFATFPIVLSTLILFLQPRIGGPSTAAIIGSGILGLMGFGVALGALHLAAQPLGAWPALALGLTICVAWNLMLMGLVRQRARPD
ncbi:MAG: hypothetical protein ACOVN4_14560 [Bosea sp. (in: a-proteobacteria)]